MPAIFLSTKFSKLIGPDRLTRVQRFEKRSPNDWNAHLFPVNGRKCILVTNKGTLYSFVRLNILKKDLQDLAAFFANSLTRQLIVDGFSETKIFIQWLESFSELNFRGTDNDKSVLGSMNDIIFQLKVAIQYGVPSLTNINDLTAGSYVNKFLHAPLGYQTPLEKLRQKNNA